MYSFNVANPRHTRRRRASYKIFEGGSVNEYDQARGNSLNRNFSGVAISATANALMVVENWWHQLVRQRRHRRRRPLRLRQLQQRPAGDGVADRHQRPQRQHQAARRLRTTGQLTDQFKMTYVHDAAAKHRHLLRHLRPPGVVSSTGCDGQS